MKIITGCYKLERGWIRILGYGICWKDLRYHPFLFSERNGYTKKIKIGNYSIRLLKKDGI